jgi:hypothetical protein
MRRNTIIIKITERGSLKCQGKKEKINQTQKLKTPKSIMSIEITNIVIKPEEIRSE